MKRFAVAVCLTCALGVPALADLNTARPMPRPVQVQAESVQTVAVLMPTLRPQPRPQGLVTKVSAPSKGIVKKLFGRKEKAETAPDTRNSAAVCRDSAIEGVMIAAIKGAQNGCGIDAPVRVTAVDGVKLSMPATLDCDTARALRKWVTNEVQPAFRSTPVVGLHVAAHYSCRGRNNVKGARISEHGRGKAIDIAGFKLANGQELSVLKDYKSSRGKPMRNVHKGACGVFGTTLGPGSDGHHENHLHFDTAKHSNGAYCK